MSTAIKTIREKLHQYIDTAEERKIQAIYVMLEDEISIKAIDDFKLIAEEIEGLDKQRENYLAGKSKTYNWEEVETELMASIKK
jgi:hypothetical protein